MKHKNKFVLCVAVALMSPLLSFAADEKSEQLGLFTSVSSECPFSRAQINDAIEGEFLRARVKPSGDLDFNLNVSVSCLAISNRAGNQTGYAVSYDIRFGTQLDDGANVLFEVPSYGSMLIGGTDGNSSRFFVNAIQDSASSALTQYLRMSMK